MNLNFFYRGINSNFAMNKTENFENKQANIRTNLSVIILLPSLPLMHYP